MTLKYKINKTHQTNDGNLLWKNNDDNINTNCYIMKKAFT